MSTMLNKALDIKKSELRKDDGFIMYIACSLHMFHNT